MNLIRWFWPVGHHSISGTRIQLGGGGGRGRFLWLIAPFEHCANDTPFDPPTAQHIIWIQDASTFCTMLQKTNFLPRGQDLQPLPRTWTSARGSWEYQRLAQLWQSFAKATSASEVKLGSTSGSTHGSRRRWESVLQKLPSNPCAPHPISNRRKIWQQYVLQFLPNSFQNRAGRVMHE